jgi:hypothetical protein
LPFLRRTTKPWRTNDQGASGTGIANKKKTHIFFRNIISQGAVCLVQSSFVFQEKALS